MIGLSDNGIFYEKTTLKQLNELHITEKNGQFTIEINPKYIEKQTKNGTELSHLRADEIDLAQMRLDDLLQNGYTHFFEQFSEVDQLKIKQCPNQKAKERPEDEETVAFILNGGNPLENHVRMEKVEAILTKAIEMAYDEDTSDLETEASNFFRGKNE